MSNSNDPCRITAPTEILEQAIVELLGRIPETWQKYGFDDLAQAQSKGDGKPLLS